MISLKCICPTGVIQMDAAASAAASSSRRAQECREQTAAVRVGRPDEREQEDADRQEQQQQPEWGGS